MQYLRIDELSFYKKISPPIRNYKYNCFRILDDYLNTQIYYDYLNSLKIYTLKNIWNHIALKWIQMQMNDEILENEEYIQSVYSKQKYNHIHEKIQDKELNSRINKFINKDPFKGLFVINCIQNYLFPY